MRMDLRSIKCNEKYSKILKKCEFCGEVLTPIGLDFLYANASPEGIQYERCTCDKAQEYWKSKDAYEAEMNRRLSYKKLIDEIYRQSNAVRKFQEMKFENLKVDSGNETAIKIANDYTNKVISGKQSDGLIISGESGSGKTYLATAIANRLIENEKIVLIGRLTTLLDMIKETFKNSSRTESELIEMFSNIDMIIIDDLGTEKCSNWSLEKLYAIVENRNENGLPIIITTRLSKQGLIERFSMSQDKYLANAIISKLYQMCYGITLKRIKEKELV